MCCFDQTAKQRVWSTGPREEFRVVLASGEKRMILEFNQFHQASVRRCSAHFIPRFKKQIAVGVVELITVAMAFIDHLFAV